MGSCAARRTNADRCVPCAGMPLVELRQPAGGTGRPDLLRSVAGGARADAADTGRAANHLDQHASYSRRPLSPDSQVGPAEAVGVFQAVAEQPVDADVID